MRLKRLSATRISSFTFLSVLAICIAGFVSPVRADDCKPRTDEVALFENENYSGRCVMKGLGEHRVIERSRLSGRSPRDATRQSPVRFSSLRLGSNVEVLAYSETNLNGNYAFIYRDTPNFAGLELTSVFSLIVRVKDEPPQCRVSGNQVAHWDRPHFFGRCWTHEVNEVTTSQIGIRSLRVGANVEALLCDDFSFRGSCVTMLPGHYSRWSFPRSGDNSVSMQVRLKNSSSCMPGANQVSVYQYEHFAGPCSVFDIGTRSLNEALSWVESLADYENVAGSFRVGNDVQATFCWTDRPGRRRCASPLTMNVSERFRTLRRSEQVSISIQERGSTPPDGDRSRNAPPAVSPHDYTLMLAAHVPFTGLPWWTGRFPTIGRTQGNLTRIQNPRNSVWLGFLKQGYGSADCGNSDAYIYLGPGKTMTADQMVTLFGSQRPALPVQFLVCSGAVGQQAAGGGLYFPALPLNISYTERR